MSMSDHEVGEYLDVLEGTMQAYDRVDALPDYLPEVRYPRTPGYAAVGGREPARRLVREVRGQGRAVRPARRQARRPEGQHLPRRRADDERRVDARRLRPRRRRDGRDAHPRRRRHDRRQGALRVLLPLGRQPHVGGRAGAQPVQARLFGGRLVERLRRARRRGRDRDGDRRRPGRLDPHARLVSAASTA